MSGHQRYKYLMRYLCSHFVFVFLFFSLLLIILIFLIVILLRIRDAIFSSSKLFLRLILLTLCFEEAVSFDVITDTSFTIERERNCTKYYRCSFSLSLWVYLDSTRIRLASSYKLCGAIMIESWMISPLGSLLVFI